MAATAIQLNYEEPFVFISYCHQQKTDVYAIVNILKTSMPVWLDVEQMQFGQMDVAMARGIEKCAAVAVFFSSDYCNSVGHPNCQKELTYANEQQKPIIYIKMQDQVTEESWFSFSRTGHIWSSYPKDGASVCAEKIAAFVNTPPPTATVQQPAADSTTTNSSASGAVPSNIRTKAGDDSLALVGLKVGHSQHQPAALDQLGNVDITGGNRCTHIVGGAYDSIDFASLRK